MAYEMPIGGFNVLGMGGNTGGMLAGNPFGPQFVIPQRGIRGMSREEIEGLKKWDPQSAPAIENIYRNVKPGGPQPFPLAYSNGSSPAGNIGALEDIAQGYTQTPSWAPRTNLPAPGWNPGMIGPSGNPNFRPSPQWNPTGPSQANRTPLAWQNAGFQTKMVS